MHRHQIDAALAARLVAEQFPEWAALPVTPVAESGWDNRTFRLGSAMTVRLPSAEGYVASVEKELTWLPRLAPQLPLPIPVAIAVGVPSAEYPWPWSIRGWIDGRPAARQRIGDMLAFADDLAAFLHALHRADPTGGPAAGAHSFYRGASLEVYDGETRDAIATLAGRIDAAAATAAWESALAARWTGDPVWFHGDIASGNLLVDDTGRLCAVIDFGTSGVGDPACDLVITWTLFNGESRERYRTRMAADQQTWVRARGWALWKALITMPAAGGSPGGVSESERVLDAVLAEFVSS
ncbi:aminoglycoside phosphotransferase family protein [Pseudonocardia sp. GCM10023141]|uniref:aminoglycoside phosphotransferase family protein n=1 Tax=Pseudonocardia sp. GCM10023141 TaxID=3252653 RepID=UPI003615C5FE